MDQHNTRLTSCLIYGTSTVGKTSLVNHLKSVYKSSDCFFEDTDRLRDSVYNSCRLAPDIERFQRALNERIVSIALRQAKHNKPKSLFTGVDLQIEGFTFPENFDLKKFLFVFWDKEEHWEHFYKRVSRICSYNLAKQKFDDIRKYQDDLLVLAEKNNIPVLESGRAATNKVINALELDMGRK
jgi:hypothetical protein